MLSPGPAGAVRKPSLQFPAEKDILFFIFSGFPHGIKEEKNKVR